MTPIKSVVISNPCLLITRTIRSVLLYADHTLH